MNVTYMIFTALVAGIVGFLVGMIWYGPLLGKEWMHAMKMKKMPKPHVWQFVGAYLRQFLSALILVVVLSSFNLHAALFMVVLLWFGFTAMPIISSILWEEKPIALYVINVAYELVNFLAMTLVVVLMR